MRSMFLSASCIGIVGFCAFLVGNGTQQDIVVTIRLVDRDTGEKIPGMIRIFEKDRKTPLTLKDAYPRLKGLKTSAAVRAWHVIPTDGLKIRLPRKKILVEAISGLESASYSRKFDLTSRAPQEITLKLEAAFRPEKHGLAAGNTHLHLRNMNLKQTDEYIRTIPAADRLKVLFISYLERFKDDETYITNKYSIGDLPQFSASGVLVNNGEEHRHNFTGFGQGYGHVMLLNIKRLVKPVSIGPGIMKSGHDGIPLRRGIDDARKQGGTIIWCHNTFGHEDVLNAITGRLHGLNVFDGSRRGSFEENYYRYLNLGIRMPISTGTDWFMYDFSRVYAKVNGKLTIPNWLNALKAGRCSATNGPLLTLEVDGHDIGSVIDVKKQKKVRVVAKGVGRHDFQRLQLIQNGRVVKTVTTNGKSPYRAVIEKEFVIDSPTWFAARIESDTKNELDQGLFAHTSPVYVDVKGKGVFEIDAARALLKQIEEGKADIRQKGVFRTKESMNEILALYDAGAALLRKRINERR